jgi:uncharacterized protein (TIGR00251 family)
MTDPPRAEVLVRVQPRASKAEVAAERDGRILVRVTAPPADGRANAAVVALLAKRLGLPKSRVRILSGQAARDKRIEIEGLTTTQATQLLRKTSR